MLIPGTYGYVIFQGKGDLQCNERSCDGEMTLDYLGEVLSERSLSVEERCKLWERVEARGAWCAAVHGVVQSWAPLSE